MRLEQIGKRPAQVGENRRKLNVALLGGALGWIAIGLSLILSPAAVLDYVDAHPGWIAHATAVGILLIAGITCILIVEVRETASIRPSEAIAAIILIWCAVPLIGTLPFILSPLPFTFTDAAFEAVSGMTATGATVMADIDTLPRGLLYWRAAMQFIGGAGVVILAAAVLPQLGLGGMQLFRMEFFDRDRVLPRFQTIARYFVGFYVGFGALCFVSYILVDMPWFDALCHAMTTIATGGLSTKSQSFAAFDSLRIEAVAIVFMLASALPFMLYIHIIINRQVTFLRNRQVFFFLSVWSCCVLFAMASRLVVAGELPDDVARFVVKTAFNVTSFLTTTGYVSEDYQAWGSFAYPLFLLLMLMGGCAGSTTGGLKQFRLLILGQKIRFLILNVVNQDQVRIVTINDRPVKDTVIDAVLSYLSLYAITLLVFTLLLSLTGLDLTTALSTSVMGITNGGVGLGTVVGPTGSFISLPDMSKWLVIALMLLGRLEILVLLAPFTKAFWKG